MPVKSQTWSHRDSWPPTQVRLSRSVSNKSEPRPLLEDIDETPLTYFLTPPPGQDMDGLSDDELVFDAGIEDINHPQETVRSVSPSSLDGLSKFKPGRAASPDFDSDVPTTDEEDDEDYIRFSPLRASFLSPFRSLSADNLNLRSKSPPFGRTGNCRLSAAASFPAPQSSPFRSSDFGNRGRHGLSRSLSSSPRPRPRRLWREPSPDVWSIEEETEEEVLHASTGCLPPRKQGEMQGQDGLAAKPKKKVRFLLPARE